jgi:putative intracellular protease/amidase
MLLSFLPQEDSLICGNATKELNDLARRHIVWGVLVLALFGLVGYGGWILSLPLPVNTAAQPVPSDEMAAIIDRLKPPKRERPIIAVVGINDATEVTDYLMPTGILRRADIADVSLLATASGPVKLFPALAVEPDATLAEFDARVPDGADYVIVPQMSRADDPVMLAWIRQQAEKGATILGICAGARIVGAAGLLDNKRATTHWYYVDRLREDNPSVTYVPDRRIVADKGVITTTGITASMPITLMMIEAIAGRGKAEAVAADLGLAAWDASHASARFKLTRPMALAVAKNVMAFWNYERLGFELQPQMDEVSIALVSDAWTRTFKAEAISFAASKEPVQTRNGIRLIPDDIAANWRQGERLPSSFASKPADALDQALNDIGKRYGEPTADAVATQLEYPR